MLSHVLPFWNPMNRPGSSVHGILLARILEWVAISSSRGSSWPGICIIKSLHISEDIFITIKEWLNRVEVHFPIKIQAHILVDCDYMHSKNIHSQLNIIWLVLTGRLQFIIGTVFKSSDQISAHVSLKLYLLLYFCFLCFMYKEKTLTNT